MGRQWRSPIGEERVLGRGGAGGGEDEKKYGGELGTQPHRRVWKEMGDMN